MRIEEALLAVGRGEPARARAIIDAPLAENPGRRTLLSDDPDLGGLIDD